MMNSIAFLVYFAVDKPTAWFVIVLFFTEVIPWIGIGLMIWDEKSWDIKTRSSGSRSTGKTNKGSSDVSENVKF